MVNDLKDHVEASCGVPGYMPKTFADRRCMQLALRRVTFDHRRCMQSATKGGLELSGIKLGKMDP